MVIGKPTGGLYFHGLVVVVQPVEISDDVVMNDLSTVLWH